MSNKKRPYLVINQTTGSETLVIAISQAQAISHVARQALSAYPAAPLDVVNHMANGGKVSDATEEPKKEPENTPPPAPDPGTLPPTQSREQLDDDDIEQDPPAGEAAPSVGGGEAEDWEKHINSGIAGQP